MGMYTELVMAAEMNPDVPADVLEVLRYMVGDVKAEPDTLPNHPLFKTHRWSYMLQCDSFYFAGDTRSTLTLHGEDYWSLTIRTNLKNYESEIEHFIDWLLPYTAEEGFVGYSRYEEADEPTLIYARPRMSVVH